MGIKGGVGGQSGNPYDKEDEGIFISWVSVLILTMMLVDVKLLLLCVCVRGREEGGIMQNTIAFRS